MLDLLLPLSDQFTEGGILGCQLLGDALSSSDLDRASRGRIADDLDLGLELTERGRLVDRLRYGPITIIEKALFLLRKSLLTSKEAGFLHGGSESTTGLVGVETLLEVLTIQRQHHRVDTLGLLRLAGLHAFGIELNLVGWRLCDVAIANKHTARNLQELGNNPRLGLELG